MTEYRHATIYPDAPAAAGMDAIPETEARTLPDLFRARVARTPNAIAYIQHHPATDQWREYSWQQTADDAAAWHRALAADGLAAGECAAICMRNCREWVLFDQACLAAGLVVVPLYADDRPDNIAYILAQTETRLLVVESQAMWREMAAEMKPLSGLIRVVVVNDDAADSDSATTATANPTNPAANDPRILPLTHWLAAAPKSPTPPPATAAADNLATIVYTSGTTGRPKGVMLSHANIISNAAAGLRSVAVSPADKLLSFLPLSHMFERTVGYYLPMMAGATVAFSRSIPDLPADMARHRPSILISVPRIFERAHAAIQARLEEGPALRRRLFALAVEVGWRRFEIAQGRANWHPAQLLWPLLRALVASKIRARFGGNLRFVVSGGAPLAANISRVFIALGIEVLQGYGLTETGPILTANTRARNQPASIGLPLAGVEIRLTAAGELQARSRGVMLGYWRDDAATRACVDADGWFSSGDLADLDANGFLRITGRIKEIIVLANGEKVPPADMEAAICEDPLFEQAMVLGEARAYLTALVVLNADAWPKIATQLGVDATDPTALRGEVIENLMLARIARQLRDFPGYAAVRRVRVSAQMWSIATGELTPTMKIKRPVLTERFAADITRMYAGH